MCVDQDSDKENISSKGSEGENRPSEPKNGIWEKIYPQSPKKESVWSCPSIGNFYTKQEKIYFWGSKRQKLSFRSTNMEFGAQNQYGRVIYPSIGNFILMKKIHVFRCEKGENKPSEPKHWIWAPKSDWLCVKFYLNGQKGENKP
jgi:hypothetical protein